MSTSRPAPLSAKPGGLKFESLDIQARYIKMLVYGKPGVGKTKLAGSAEDDPRIAPVLFADVEGGVLTLSRYDVPDNERKLKVVRVTDFESDMQSIYSFLGENQVHPDLGEPFKCLVVDSLTELQKLSMKGIMREVVKRNPGRDPEQPQLQEWGLNLEQVRRVVRAFRDLPIHVIMISLEKEDRDERTGEVTLSPSLSGKLAPEVAGFFDIVGRLYVDNEHTREADGTRRTIPRRRLLVSATEKYIAKDRTDRLGIIVEEPTIPKMLDQILQKPKPKG